jgi:GntR family transcriptional regulator
VLPVYLQIKEALAKEIASGAIAPGELMPSEAELMRTWSVSRITARNVVKELSKDGLIYTVHGRGSFVAQARVTNVLPTLNSYSHDVARQGMRAGSRVLSLAPAAADNEVAARLLIQPGAPVIAFRRLHLANGRPVSVSSTALPLAALGPAREFFTRSNLENQSLYSLFEERGFVLTGGEQEVSASAATAEEARLLDVKRGAPLLYADRIVFAQNKGRVEYTRIWTRPDRSRWKIELGPMASATASTESLSENQPRRRAAGR